MPRSRHRTGHTTPNRTTCRNSSMQVRPAARHTPGTPSDAPEVSKNTAATVIGDVTGRTPIRHLRPLRRVFSGTRSRVSPATARPPAGAARERGAANDATHMTAITQIRTGTAKARRPRSSTQRRQRRKPRSSGCSRSAVARPGRQDTVADATRREPPNLPSQASAQLTRTQRYETADCPNAEPVPPCRLRALIGVDFTASWWRADYPDLCKSGCCGAGIASGYFLARTALVRPGA